MQDDARARGPRRLICEMRSRNLHIGLVHALVSAAGPIWMPMSAALVSTLKSLHTVPTSPARTLSTAVAWQPDASGITQHFGTPRHMVAHLAKIGSSATRRAMPPLVNATSSAKTLIVSWRSGSSWASTARSKGSIPTTNRAAAAEHPCPTPRPTA